MPALPALQKDLIYSSDYPMDKVIYLTTGSATCGALGSGSQLQTITIPHGLGFAPLVLGSWTLDSSWDTSYDMDSGPPGTTLNPSDQLVRVWADATNIEVQALNFSSGSVTVYARVYAFCPSDQDPTVEHTASISSQLQFNSDDNYTKLYDAGLADVASTSGGSYSIPHALGYKPQVSLWYEQLGIIYPMTTAGVGLTAYAPRVTESSIEIDLGSIPDTRFHWRIYLDEQ